MPSSFVGVTANLSMRQQKSTKAPPAMIQIVEIVFMGIEPEYTITTAVERKNKIVTARIDFNKDGLAHLIGSLTQLEIDLKAMDARINWKVSNESL